MSKQQLEALLEDPSKIDMIRYLLSDLKGDPDYPQYLKRYRDLVQRTTHKRRTADRLEESLQLSFQAVEQNQQLVNHLMEQTQQLKGTDDRLEMTMEHLKGNQSVLKDIGNKDTKDRWILLVGILIFFSTLMYIVYKRLFT